MSKSRRPSKTTLRRFAFAVALIVMVGAAEHPSKGAAQPDTRVRPAARIPLSFEANLGQSDTRLKFLARMPAYTLFLTSSETVLALTPPPALEPGVPQPPAHVVRLRLIGARSNPAFEGLDPLPGRSHYFIGRDRQRWSTGVPHYARVGVRDVYPGIDQVFYAAAGELEYDLVVQAGADPSRVRIGFEGVDVVRIGDKGDLILTTDDGEISQRAPLAYQETDLSRTIVPAKYVLGSAHEVSIEVGAFDHTRPLVIDPVLVYASFLGGSSDDTDFPSTAAAFQPVRGGGFVGTPDAFVLKIAP